MAVKAVALMGATGTGKSLMAIELAAQSGSSIIVCDSMQVYMGLDIGTAKPGSADRERFEHFMLDCAELPDVFSAARWAREAKAVIKVENARGRVPLITGGTGLYLRALLEQLADIPDEDADVRQRLMREADETGTPAMHARLAAVDADTALRLSPNDTQRILRALAVFESSGVPLSEWTRKQSPEAEIDCPVFVLDMERSLLRQRLDTRFRAMLEAGWLEEVRWLASLGLADRHPAMRAVGYRQLLAHVRGGCRLSEAVEKGVIATRQYGKRQETWFRHQAAGARWGDAKTLAPELLQALGS
ncbi:MAG: tRNA (adenosine(37)-N6)-dimethylallyltransferase MiaA [Mariprofundaceae bacterium]